MSEKALVIDRCPVCDEQFLATSCDELYRLTNSHELDQHGEIQPANSQEIPDFR